MVNRKWLFGLGLMSAGLLALVLGVPAADDKDTADKHGEHFDKCAKACAHCAGECESCASHCAHMLAEGKKDHLKTLQFCRDCAEFCVAAGRIVARHGPFSTTICEACAKACDGCAKACEKFPDDKHMAGCAKACRDCAKACREMVKHAGD
jgi:hypothetical protein